jgi:RNA polymerase sigma-B factor
VSSRVEQRDDTAASGDADAMLEMFRAYRRTRDRDLRNALVEHYIELARALARRFANRNEPLDDLEQVAMLGVLKAVERFDPEHGTPFVGFAVPTVMGELRRHFRDHGWMVRVPRRIQNLHLHLNALITDLAQLLERSPTIEEIADAAGVPEEDVLEALEAANCYRPNTLDLAPAGGDASDRVESPDDEVGAADDRLTLLPLIEHLPRDQQRIVYLRYFEDLTQADIAAKLGISQMQVSRLLTRSLATLAAGVPDEH